MVIVFCYKGKMESSLLRDEVMRRYNKIIGNSVDVRLFYDDDAPYIDGNGDVSITHTRHVSGDRIELIAISSDKPIGIDIEPKERNVDLNVAKRYFEPDEIEYIGDDKSRFMEIWQKKEAYGKRLKVGLYRKSVIELKYFREYELYEGYNAIIYSRDKDIVFVTI